MFPAAWGGAWLTGAAAPCSLSARERLWVESTRVAGRTVGLQSQAAFRRHLWPSQALQTGKVPVVAPAPPFCGSRREHSVAMK